MEIATLVVWAGGYTALVFVAVCLATGLYYLAELVEEYTVLTKKLLSWAIMAELALYVLLLVWDRLPPLACASGLLAHVLYGTLLRKFPFISLSSPEFLASCVLLVVSHYLWMQHFMTSYHTIEYVMAFFLMMVWLVPFGFFISLAANESVLPTNMGSGGGGLYGAGGSMGDGSTGGGTWGRDSGSNSFSNLGDVGGGGGGGKRSRGGLLSVMNFLKSQRDKVLLPQVNSHLNRAGLGKEKVRLL